MLSLSLPNSLLAVQYYTEVPITQIVAFSFWRRRLVDPGKFTLSRARGGSWGCFYMVNLSIASCDSATWMGRCPSSRWTGGSGLLVHCFTFTHVFGAWYDSSVNSQLLHLIKAYFFSVLIICLPGAGFQFSHAKIIQIRWCLAVLTKYQVTVLSRYSK